MNTALWGAQIVLALAFTVTGLLKILVSHAALAARAGWVTEATPSQVRAVGVLEILAVFGLMLPALADRFAWLTPLAAVGLVLTMIAATYIHLRRREYGYLPLTLCLMALAAFVAYGRVFAATG